IRSEFTLLGVISSSWTLLKSSPVTAWKTTPSVIVVCPSRKLSKPIG
ncbi:hypothetical protein D030_3854B, partial [Vibrio parahaemolyticus AQ3810]